MCIRERSLQILHSRRMPSTLELCREEGIDHLRRKRGLDHAPAEAHDVCIVVLTAERRILE